MLRKGSLLLLIGIVSLGSATTGLAQDVPGDVHVKLSLADNKTVYRIGEPIKLVLEFTADREGYQADTYSVGDALPTDNIVVSPDSGVAHWLEEYLSGRYFMRDVISLAALSAKPNRIELLLIRWPPEAKAGLFAYFARYNEKEALPLIEQSLADLEPGQDFSLLPDLTRLYYSDGIDALLRRRLEGDEPRAASTAAYLLGLHGPPSDKEIIEARLERWRKEWGNRAAEARNNLQGTVEREMVWTLTHSKSWKLSPERIKELEQGCVTDLCRQNFPK